MKIGAHRIMIEDPEDNFLYLNLAAPLTDVEILVAIVNRASNGRARLEPPMSAEDQELTLEAIERARRRVDR